MKCLVWSIKFSLSFIFFFFQPCTKKRVGESFLSSQLKLNLSGNLIMLVESRKRLTWLTFETRVVKSFPISSGYIFIFFFFFLLFLYPLFANIWYASLQESCMNLDVCLSQYIQCKWGEELREFPGVIYILWRYCIFFFFAFKNCLAKLE